MFPHTEIQKTQSLLGPISGAVAGFLLIAITVVGIAIAVLAHCKKNATHPEDPVYDYIDTENPLYDYIDTENPLYDYIDTDDRPTFPMQPISDSLETAINTAYGTTVHSANALL